MKTNNHINLSNVFKLVALCAFFVSSNFVHGQFYCNDIIHINQGSLLYANSVNFSLENNSAVTTSKIFNSNNNGKLILGSSSTISYNSTQNKFIDGSVEIFTTSPFVINLGHLGVFAPISVTAVNNSGVTATYFDETYASSFPSLLDSSVSNVSFKDFWVIKGANSNVTLSWRPNSFTNSFAFSDIIIVGLRNGKWEEIPSQADLVSIFDGSASVINLKGSVSSLGAINLSIYDAFSIGKKGVPCGEIYSSSNIVTSWDGNSWSPSVPTINDSVIINGAYANGSFECYSAILNADINLSNNQTIKVVGNVSGTGKILLASEASFVQIDGNATSPNIELIKSTRQIKQFDYVYWGSPVSQDVFSQIDNAFVTGYSLGAFDNKFSYISGITGSLGGWQNLSSISLGKGFITRVKQQSPFNTPSDTGVINLKFSGTANNGEILVPVTNVIGEPLSARNNNLLANPYPSAIDASKFLTENSDLLDGAIYLWRANTTNDGFSNYSVGDYIAFTKVGSTAYSGTGGIGNFNGNISSGQGFKVKALTNGNVKFNNCMRVSNIGSNNQFYRTNEYTANSVLVLDRFKINISNDSGKIANQILIAYTPDASEAYDKMYDADLYSVSPNQIYSLMGSENRKLAINAKPSFSTSDEINLGFKKEIDDLGLFSISIVDLEGVFSNKQVPIYLYDISLNTYHDLTSSAYKFSSTLIEDNKRFKIVYDYNGKNNLLDNASNIIATFKNESLSLFSNVNISEVTVFDLSGRIVYKHSLKNDSNTFKTSFVHEKGVYLVSCTLSNGKSQTIKIIN